MVGPSAFSTGRSSCTSHVPLIPLLLRFMCREESKQQLGGTFHILPGTLSSYITSPLGTISSLHVIGVCELLNSLQPTGPHPTPSVLPLSAESSAAAAPGAAGLG